MTIAALVVHPGGTGLLLMQAHAALAPASLVPALTVPQNNTIVSPRAAADTSAEPTTTVDRPAPAMAQRFQIPAPSPDSDRVATSGVTPSQTSQAKGQTAASADHTLAGTSRPAEKLRAPAGGSPALGINDLPAGKVVVLTAETPAHLRQVFVQGQSLHRDASAFAKVGDSTMVYPPLLESFGDRKSYDLGPYAYLQTTVDTLSTSFSRKSAAVRKGMHAWSEFDPDWVAIEDCHPGEGPLACELRISNAGIALIRLGANDVTMPTEYEANLRKILDYCLANGVIPVVGTKPDRGEGPQNTINGIVHRLATEYKIPLWDYDLVASTVSGKGLAPDQIHFAPGGTHDFSSPSAYQNAAPLEDLSALMALDTVRAIATGR